MASACEYTLYSNDTVMIDNSNVKRLNRPDPGAHFICRRYGGSTESQLAAFNVPREPDKNVPS
jgi:hypothetical protein